MDINLLFLIYNRPETEQKVFNKIRTIKPKRLYVAADGPKLNLFGDKDSCNRARNIIDKGIDWDCEVKKLYRNENLGCKDAISSALDWFFENVEEGIILEDDCLPDLSFFRYCKELLYKYKNNNKIFLITGNNNQKYKWSINSYYFSRYPHIWGWASWRRSWKYYDVNMNDWLKIKENKNIRFGLLENEYWRRIFNEVYKGNVNTWDYQVTYCCLKNRLLNIIPKVNLVKNIGVGVKATHTMNNQETPESKNIDFPLVHPNSIHADWVADLYTISNHYRISLLSQFISLFKYIFNI